MLKTEDDSVNNCAAASEDYDPLGTLSFFLLSRRDQQESLLRYTWIVRVLTTFCVSCCTSKKTHKIL